MVSCLCFSKPSTRYDTEVDVSQTLVNNLDVAQQARDAPPAAAASPGARAGKLLFDQTNSARDVRAGVDKSPVKAAVTYPTPALDATPSIWEKLASHEIKSLTATPEPAEAAVQAPAQAVEAAARTQTPDLTITGTGIKPQPMPAAAAVAATVTAKPASAKKPWNARTTPNKVPSSGEATNTTPARRPPSACKTSNPGTPPSASRLLKPTAASAARAQAITKPKHEELLWKH